MMFRHTPKRALLLGALVGLVVGLAACEDETSFIPEDDAAIDARAPDQGLPDGSPDADLLVPDTALGPPTISSVTDKGQDGIAVVGEVVYLQGQNFGGGCTVAVGGKTAKVLSQSQQDLSFQTPEGIVVGKLASELTCTNGKAAFDLTVNRYHLVSMPDRSRVAVLEESTPGVFQKRTLEVTVDSPDGMVLSNDSAVAYVASERNLLKTPKVSIIDLTQKGGPALMSPGVPYNEPVKMPVFGLATAANAPVLALAVGLSVLLYDITDPLAPVKKGSVQFVTLSPGRTLPQISTGFFIDVALTPDGKTAVLLDGAADHIHIYDISTLSAPKALQTKVKVSAGTSAKPIVELPVITGLLGKLKVQGGSAQKLAISADGSTVLCLAGGGFGALVPETFNLDFSNSTISVFDITSNAYVNQLESLPKAHFPNNAAYSPTGDAFVSSLSSATAQLTKIIFQIAVKALISGGIDLTSIASLLFKSYSDLIDIIKAAWDGTLFDLGGLYRVVNNKASQGSFAHIPYIQGGLCTTYDGTYMLSAGQGWIVDIELGFPQIVKKFVFKYDLGVTIHNLSKKDSYTYQSLYSWQLKMLLPPWFFGSAACQQ